MLDRMLHGGQIDNKEIAFRMWPRIMTEVYLSVKFGPNISDFSDLCLHWVSIVIDEMLHQKIFRPILIFVVVFIIHLKHLQQVCEYNAVT